MPANNQTLRMLKGLIWVYLFLLIFEGALRKWVLPGLSSILLIARDPLVALIYVVALSNKRFVVNGYIIAGLFLAFTSFIAGLLVSNIFVTMIGLRCYFLHLPLIFVMERALDRDDVFRMGKFLFWIAPFMTVLVVDQFYSPQTAYVNLDLGGIVGLGMPGANNHFRPSGTFSFTTGVAEFFPLVLAMLLAFMLTRRKLPLYLSIIVGLAVVISIPFSISRTNALSCAIVLVTAGVSLLFLPKPPLIIARSILIAGVIGLIIPQLSFFDEGLTTFESRWVDSTGKDAEGFKTNIVDRALDDIIPPMDFIFNSDSLLGVGVGAGTNMATAFLSGGQRDIVLAESEWPRVLLEMGPVLGLGFIFMRIALCGHLVAAGIAALRRNNVVPILLAADSFLLVLNSQWSQATTLGFAMFGAGLTLAAANVPSSTTTTAPIRRSKPAWQPPPIHQWKPLGEPVPDATLPAPLPEQHP
jgi:hypothetical protein